MGASPRLQRSARWPLGDRHHPGSTTVAGQASAGRRPVTTCLTLVPFDVSVRTVSHTPQWTRRTRPSPRETPHEAAGQTHTPAPGHIPRRVFRGTRRRTRTRLSNQENCRSEPLCSRLENRHALHERRHRKEVVADESRRTPTQGLFSGSLLRVRAPRASRTIVHSSSSLATGIRNFKDGFLLRHQDVLGQSQQGRRAFDACRNPVGVLDAIRA